MSNKIKVLPLAILSVLVLCSVLVLLSELGASNIVRAQNEPAKLSLEILSSQESYLQAEPILINLKLSNQTNQPISWRGFLGGGSNINFSVRNAAGVESRWEGNRYQTGYVHSILQIMQPGKQVQESLLLGQKLVEELFPSPGQYDLRVEFVYYTQAEGNQKTKISSNSVSVNILEPQGNDRQAYQSLKGTLATAHSQTNNRAVAQAKQEFVNKFRNTVYAKYIIFSLANTYQIIGEDEKALRELCKISGENFHYSKEVEEIVFIIERKLRPVVLQPLPENAPTPPVIHPCTGRRMN